MTSQIAYRLACIIFIVFFINTSSAKAVDLGEYNCGPIFGGISIEFSKQISNFKQIDSKLKNNEWYRADFRNPFEPANYKAKTDIRKELSEAWKLRSDANEWERGNIITPIGSEEFIAEALLSSGIIRQAKHLKAPCGGGESAYFALSGVSGLESATRFEDTMKILIQRYLNKVKIASLTDTFAYEEGRLVVSPISPKYSTKIFHIRAASEITRATTKTMEWDSFDVVLEYYKKTKRESIIRVYAENLKNAPRAGKFSVPSPEHFRPKNASEPDYYGELVVAAGIANSFGGGTKNCMVNADTSPIDFDAKKDGPFRCSRDYDETY